MAHRLKILPLIVLAACAAGCPHRQAGPGPASGEAASYRRENLFASFDPAARDVSLVNAYLLELACYVGDKGTFELDRTLETWGFTRRRDFRDIQTSTYGYVASNDRMVLVTFGGTDVLNVRDLLSDADALQLVYDERYCATPDARVHRGFRDSLNSVIDGVIDEVRRQAGDERVAERPQAGAAASMTQTATRSTPTRSAVERAAARRAAAVGTGAGGEGSAGVAAADAQPSQTQPAAPRRKTLWVAGHSRGGAFAALAAAAFARAGDLPEVAGVYTFGQPRVGNGAFARQLAAGPAGVPLFRFVNRDDPVPNVPPSATAGPAPVAAGRLGLTLDYQHAGTVVLLREDGRVVRASEAELSRSLPDPRAGAASVSNHYQPAYQNAIYAALSNPNVIDDPAWRATVPPSAAAALPKPGP